MIGKIASFEISEKKFDEALSLIEQFTRMVRYAEPGTKMYVSLQSENNKYQFKHVMIFENEGAEVLHRNSGHTTEFTKLLYPLCKTEPTFESFNAIGE